MAGSFDDILNLHVTDENDRGSLAELANKYPDLKSGWLRQSDYSRKLDSFRDTEKDLRGQVEQWNSWAESNWDHEAGRPKAEVYWETRAKELEAKGGDMSFDEILKGLKEQGFVQKDDFSKTLEEKSKQVDEGFQGTAYYSTKLTELASNHYAEFNKPFKATEFVGKLKEFGTNDLDAAYEKYVADTRKERADKDLEAKLEQTRKEAYEKAQQEIMAKLPTGGLPVDQGGESGLGHLQAKMRHVGDPDAAAKATLGDGTLAALAAQEFHKKQLGQS